MADLSVLANIPGYGAYVAKSQLNEQQGVQDLQKIGSLVQLRNSMLAQQNASREQQRQTALQTAIAAIPPEKRNAETILPLVKQYGSPMEALKLESDIESRKEARAQQAAVATQNYELRKATLEQQRELALQRAQDKKDQDAINNSFKQRQLEMDAQHREAMRLLGQQNLELRKDIQAAKEAPGGGGLTPENAGKVSMSQQAVDGIGKVRSIIFSEDGKSLNKGLIGAMNLPVVSGLPGNSQARIARTAIRNAVEAKLRIETGAAATESEVERTLARFLPTIGDTPESAKYKLDELEKFFKTSLSLTKGVKPAAQNAEDPLGIRGH